MEQAFNSEGARLDSFMQSGIFPHGSASERDQDSRAGGFIKGYELRSPTYFEALTETHQECIPLPDVAPFAAAAAAILSVALWLKPLAQGVSAQNTT